MADFVQTMKDWRRMCKVYTVFKHECEGCPLENIAEHACGAIFEPEFADVVNWQKLEGFVGKWATEHPELVYPTWGDWLAEIGLISWQNNGDVVNSVMVPTFKMCKHIPADIAEKMGIKPKDVKA